MFDFFKRIKFLNNNANNKDDSMSLKFIDGGSDGISYFVDKSGLLEIDNWIKESGFTGFSFSQILDMLFSLENKNLCLQRISSEEDRISFSLQVKDQLYEGDVIELYKKPFYRGNYNMIRSYKIKIFCDNYESVYYIRLKDDVLYSVLAEDSFKEEVNGKIYTRIIYENGFSIDIKKNLFFDEIRLVCEKNDIEEILNELELKEYLLNIDDSVSINELYKKICEISLGNEIDYKKINLSLYKDGEILSSISYLNNKECLFCPKYEYEIFENNEVKNFTVGDTFILFLESSKNRDIQFKYNDYRIEFGIRPFRQDIDNDKTIVFRDYMINIELPVMIDKLCNDICNKFLIDINSCSYLKVACYYKNNLTDMIHIENGKLLELELNRDGKIIKIDKEGNFSYGYLVNDQRYMVKINEDIVIGYETYMDMGIENDDMGNVMYSRISQAKDEKVKTRKLVDSVLKRG